MQDIFEALFEFLFKLISLPGYLESLGLDKDLSETLAKAIIIILAVIISALFVPLVRYLWQRWKTAKATRDLAPYFQYLTVRNSCKLFIPTQSQNHSPTREDEPAFTHKYVFPVY